MLEFLPPWVAALLLSAVFYLVFRDRIFGIADPLFIFLVMRVVLGLAYLPYTQEFYEDAYFSALALLSSFILVFVLWLGGAQQPEGRIAPSEATGRHLLSTGAKLLFLKLILVLIVFHELPIFMDRGSDSYIDFDMENKFVSSMLLGIQYADVFLLSLALPLLAENREKYLGRFLLVLSILVSIMNFKKSAILMILLTIVFADSVRRHYFGNAVRRLLGGKAVATGVLLGVLWMAIVFRQTVDEVDLTTVNEVLNFIVSIFSQPYTVLLSYDFQEFAKTYEVNRILYFFHTITSSIFQLPAFSASIGPAFGEYQTGLLTGHGINPTYLLEGFVLLGPMFLPVYAAAVAFILCFVRFFFVNGRMSIEDRAVLIGLFFPVLYTLPVDALLAVKMALAILLIAGANIVWQEIRYTASLSAADPELHPDD